MVEMKSYHQFPFKHLNDNRIKSMLCNHVQAQAQVKRKCFGLIDWQSSCVWMQDIVWKVLRFVQMQFSKTKLCCLVLFLRIYYHLVNRPNHTYMCSTFFQMYYLSLRVTWLGCPPRGRLPTVLNIFHFFFWPSSGKNILLTTQTGGQQKLLLYSHCRCLSFLALC